jgi:hypothetical protein
MLKQYLIFHINKLNSIKNIILSISCHIRPFRVNGFTRVHSSNSISSIYKLHLEYRIEYRKFQGCLHIGLLAETCPFEWSLYRT